MSSNQAPLHISVIIPVFNEAPTLKPLYNRIRDVMGMIGVPYEIIFVDDGSSDDSLGIMEEIYRLHQEWKWTPVDSPVPSSQETEKSSISAAVSQIVVIQLQYNIGKAAALGVGFAHAAGDIVITIDADLQDDPSEIPNLLAKLGEGYDVVSGWKVNRQDSWSKVLLSRIFNRVVSWCTHLNLHDINCGLKAYRRSVIQDLQMYGDRHRYLPILAHQNGYSVTEVPVRHHQRQFGKSKYGIGRIPRGLFDLLTILFLHRYMKRPLHLFGILGSTCLFGGIAINTYLIVLWFVEGGIGFRPLLMLGILSMIMGMQFLSIGLLGEMFANAFERLDHRCPIKTLLGRDLSDETKE